MSLSADIGLWALLRHLRQWLTNLRRAGIDRRRESRSALQAVVVAARGTRVYLRGLDAGNGRDHGRETELAETWTRLGFVLRDLGLGKLAKRCDLSGAYWTDPAQFDDDFLERADIGLERMERPARQMIADID